MSEVKKRLRINRGTKAQMPTLLTGELGLAEDEEQLYIGTIGGNIPVDKITKGVVQEVSTRVGPLANLATRIKTGIVAALNGVQEDHDAHKADYAAQIDNRVKKDGDRMLGVYSIANTFMNLARFFGDTGTNTSGIKITTNIPKKIRNTMLILNISGYRYTGSMPIYLTIVSYLTTGSDTPFAPSYSSINSYQPEIKVGHENGKFVIWINETTAFLSLNVEAIMTSGLYVKADYENWTITKMGFLPEATDVVTVPFKA